MSGLGRETLNSLFIIAGAVLAGMGLKGFLLSSRFIDGGVTGISMLLAEVAGLSLPLGILIINLPFVAIGYRQFGSRFAVKSALAIVLLSLCLIVIPYPDVTPDKLLTAVFGGFFIGAGIGLAIRGGAVLAGPEIAALILSRNSSSFRVSDFILVMNIGIFLTAAIFLGVESALYSILTYAAASRTIDFLLHGLEQYTAVLIVSDRYNELKELITDRLGRGVTVFHGGGGLGSHGPGTEPREILYCVVTRLELGALKRAIAEIDDSAFVTSHGLSEVDGGLVKHKLYH